MSRLRDGIDSPPWLFVYLVVVSAAGLGIAGPVGSPNATNADLGRTPYTASCAVGDVVYMAGDEFPGSTPCDRCACGDRGKVQCTRQRCEPRPGCKAIHRPDHCCPTYQCECEQEGRVYGNGEKLVDPADPCRVCYCQGGEVVCRRIACFLRDDCRPRLVPGRCCPEYDNCPLRGVTTGSGTAPSAPGVSAADKTENISTSATSQENVKQEITIKEITPVSEIPVLTGVKIKEILPSPNIEVPEYSSSKSPLIPREVSSEKSVATGAELAATTEAPLYEESEGSSSSNSPVPNYGPAELTTKSNIDEGFDDVKSTADSLPSKISLSTRDMINSEIYISNLPAVTTTTPSATPHYSVISISTKAPVTDEEDTSFFDHNPAFPPLPDDLSVLSNHGDEIVPEPSLDNENLTSGQEVINVVSVSSPTKSSFVSVSSPVTVIEDTAETQSSSPEKSITDEQYISKVNNLNSITTGTKDSPMLNLRSAIPTEILNLPSSVPEDIDGELDEKEEKININIHTISTSTITTSETPSKTIENLHKDFTPTSNSIKGNYETSSMSTGPLDDVTHKTKFVQIVTSPESRAQEQTTSSIEKSNIATEITLRPEISSVPIETKIFNTHQTTIENIIPIGNKVTTTTIPQMLSTSDKAVSTIAEPITNEKSTPHIPSVISTKQTITVASVMPFEVFTDSAMSSEVSTDNVELFKVSTVDSKNAAIIDSSNVRKNNVLTDLINLVGDVASISDHTDGPVASISDSEELIPVNAGYKSKNNNWNLNSITEIPFKSKSSTTSNKMKAVEIEGEDEESITDSPAPFDKVEPTTKRPIIDKVSDENISGNKTVKKDIEIITQSYVPTINKRPTKVVMKKNSDKVEGPETHTRVTPGSISEIDLSEDTTTELSSGEYATSEDNIASADAIERISDKFNLTSSTILQ